VKANYAFEGSTSAFSHAKEYSFYCIDRRKGKTYKAEEGRQDAFIRIVLERIKINVSLHISNPVMRGNLENAKAKIKQVEGIARGN
jgi:hypothetical protein